MATKAEILKVIDEIQQSNVYSQEIKDNWLEILSSDYDTLSDDQSMKINFVLAMHYLHVYNKMFLKEFSGEFQSIGNLMEKMLEKMENIIEDQNKFISEIVKT